MRVMSSEERVVWMDMMAGIRCSFVLDFGRSVVQNSVRRQPRSVCAMKRLIAPLVLVVVVVAALALTAGGGDDERRPCRI